MTKKIDRNVQVKEIIQSNPGIQFRQLMRHTGMQNGVLSHYLGKLEKTGSVQVDRSPRQTRYFPLEFTQQESYTIKALRRETPRAIISALVLNEKLEFNQIVEQVKKAPSTISLYLSQLIDDEVVTVQLMDRKKSYSIKDKQVVDKLIEEYRPSMMEKPTAGFEDIINSL